jgi:predicted HicB family RNase H-like nuclease
MNILKYKGYEGTAELDMERMICRGKVLFIEDLVTYEADSPGNLQNEFEAAIDDYLETCAALGREPRRPLKGQFNVRVQPSLHKAAALRAIQDKVSLNEVVAKALDAYVCAQTVQNHNAQVTLNVSPEQIETVSMSTSSNPQWETLHVH